MFFGEAFLLSGNPNLYHKCSKNANLVSIFWGWTTKHPEKQGKKLKIFFEDIFVITRNLSNS
jgi:hypothetical protein